MQFGYRVITGIFGKNQVSMLDRFLAKNAETKTKSLGEP